MTTQHTPEPWDWKTFDLAPDGRDAYIIPANDYIHAKLCVNAAKANRLKLEAFEELKAAAEKMAQFINTWSDCLFPQFITAEEFDNTSGFSDYRVALAKAEKPG